MLAPILLRGPSHRSRTLWFQESMGGVMARTRRIVRGAKLLGALSVFGGAQLSAQGNTSSLRGMVLDEQRLAIPQATLRIEDLNGGLRRSIEVSGGSFEFAALQPGEYRLTAEAGGFQPKQGPLPLEVNQTPPFDLPPPAKGPDPRGSA